MAIFRFDPNARSIRLQAILRNGRTRAIFMALDTGASRTTIPLWVAQDLQLTPLPNVQAHAAAASGMVTASVFGLPHLSVLEQEVNNIEVIGLDLPPATGVHGLLGLNFLRSFVLVINFPKGKLALLRANSNPLQRLRGLTELMRVYW